MPSLQIGFPPFVIEVQLKELEELGRYVGRFLSRGNFVGYFHIVSKHSGKCLDVLEARTDDYVPVQQYTLHGGANQQWLFVKTPDGYYHIFARHSGKCLDIDSHSYEDFARACQCVVHGGDNQKWEIRSTVDGYHNILAKHSRKALDVGYWSQEDGGTILQYSFHGDANQCWRIVAAKGSA